MFKPCFEVVFIFLCNKYYPDCTICKGYEIYQTNFTSTLLIWFLHQMDYVLDPINFPSFGNPIYPLNFILVWGIVFLRFSLDFFMVLASIAKKSL